MMTRGDRNRIQPFVRGTGVMRPVVIHLFSASPSSPHRVAVCKSSNSSGRKVEVEVVVLVIVVVYNRS